ncbi:Nucleoside transporter FUN26 [Hyphodiscus hymeniophilus]|uniref:Nucleoside transporter FUN26 n=1 Tax=Hyphodiscus hymeniophilus TaxID=353542 RepID=A0A9P6VGE6_9HELO|nr:Nucleoside transporter FUN26 [Hyphodiscus hymeniophilus]
MDCALYTSLQPTDQSDYGSLRDSSDLELAESEGSKDEIGASFSWAEYCSFFAVGISMMWTWSMILQAVPYFQRRFRLNAWILRYFQSLNLVVFAFAIIAASFILTKSKVEAYYENRLKTSLWIYICVAMVMMISTFGLFYVSAEVYLPLVLLMVFVTAVANALSQNAAFAFAAGFGRTEYASAILTGEALAALLPSVIEIASALLVPASYFGPHGKDRQHTSPSMLLYFFLGVPLGLAALCCLKLLEYRRCIRVPQYHWAARSHNKNLRALWGKLHWPASANFLCLCLSAVSPVFASKIHSLTPEVNAPTILRREAFIPLAIVLWNIGDLLGSMFSVFFKSLTRLPYLLFFLSLARMGFIPLYLICNIDGKGSPLGNWFYLFVVQFLFGLTHGCISALSMSGVPRWVEPEEREAAGAFMGLSLVFGLVAGSGLGLLAALT